MIYWRDRNRKQPLLSPLHLAYSDVVLSRGDKNPWAPDSPPGREYIAAKALALKMLLNLHLPPTGHHLEPLHMNSYCSKCNRIVPNCWVCSSCGAVLCDPCEHLHQCEATPWT